MVSKLGTEAALWIGVVIGMAMPLPVGHAASSSPAPLVQRGYLWQRDWTPQVAEGAKEADRRMDGLVLLGGEIVWERGSPRLIKANISWESVATLRHRPALALRVAPFPGPFVPDDAAARFIADTARALLDDARRHGVEPAEFQLDFDCAQKKLAGYAVWVTAVRAAVKPVRFVITTLPVWLGEPEFPALLREVDGYVLQVHSVPATDAAGKARLCEPERARQWVRKAAKLGRPFSVALPTYRCVAGFGPEGKLLGIAMDAGQPSWPAVTRVLELGTSADEMADLVNEWEDDRPEGLMELLWYRVPVSTDARNWRWPTLAAVMQGRRPSVRYEVRCEGENPIDLTIQNTGESDEVFDRAVKVTWTGEAPVASDALPGWTIRGEPPSLSFVPLPDSHLRLAPGAKRGIGWLRFQKHVELRCKVVENEPASP